MKKNPAPRTPRATKTPEAVRANGYNRNMECVRTFKDSHPCKHCKGRFPARVMEFASPSPDEWSVSRLAGSRCNLDVLNAAMRKATLLCSNCKRILEASE